MRDLQLRHTLRSLARDASEVFSDLVEGGQEIPYEIGEPEDGFAFCQYQPLTARFVRDNAGELRELDSFRATTELLRESDLAGPYLEGAGIAPPADAHERATLAATYFLARLWDGTAGFELDGERFAAAIAEIEDCAEPEEGEVEAIVPLLGFQMPTGRLELNGASIVRADAVDVPADAARGERPSGAAWEPTFLISARVSLDPDGGLGGAGGRVAETFERVVSTLRLFKAGGVGLGPHGWVRVAGDRWRRIATGAGKPRAGGYRLTETELDRLADLSRVIAVHPRRVARLRRAMLRFEAGLDRRGAVDALNDHLLALRFLLEGEGPAGVGLPMRAAALSTGAAERGEAKAIVERALALERELWSGEPTADDGAPGPAEISARVEELLRTILRRAVSGEIGADLRAAADDALLSDGLAFGEGSADRGETTEWDLDPVPEPDDELIAHEEQVADAAAGISEHELVASGDDDFSMAAEIDALPGGTGEEEIVISRIEEQPTEAIDMRALLGAEGESPERAAGEPRTEAGRPAKEQRVQRSNLSFIDQVQEHPSPGRGPAPAAAHREPRRDGWLDEVDGDATMDFPARSSHLADLAKPPLDREEVRARVEYLFPRTETNWTVRTGGPTRAAS